MNTNSIEKLINDRFINENYKKELKRELKRRLKNKENTNILKLYEQKKYSPILKELNRTYKLSQKINDIYTGRTPTYCHTRRQTLKNAKALKNIPSSISQNLGVFPNVKQIGENYNENNNYGLNLLNKGRPVIVHLNRNGRQKVMSKPYVLNRTYTPRKRATSWVNENELTNWILSFKKKSTKPSRITQQKSLVLKNALPLFQSNSLSLSKKREIASILLR